MSRNVRVLHCTPEDVFRVLGNGWLYPAWVVGASRMRIVEESWPMAGSELHHSFGVWPVLIDDKTVVEVWDPPRRMVMRARGWPVGEARVTIDVKPRGADCLVRIQEEPIAGPGNVVPRAVTDPPLHWRNTETLHRLAYLAEGMATRPDSRADSEISDADRSARETQQKQADPRPEALDGDVDAGEVKVVPGTGGPDDPGDVEVPAEDLNLPSGQSRDADSAG